MIKIIKAEYIENFCLLLTFIEENFQSRVKIQLKKKLI